MIRMNGVSKSYGDVVAVDGVSLDIRKGEVFGLLGPNGAGKSTTISMIVGLLRPDRGSVELEGLGPPTDHTVRAHIGVATQAVALYEDMTGAENLAFFGRLFGLGGRPLRQRVDELLTLTGLTEKARVKVKAYSGGMKRRLNLAAAIVHDPAVVLLDEPTAGVDPQSRNAIFEIVGRLRDEGRTVVYTTHYMEEAQRLCDRIAIMDKGRVLALDTVDGLIESHAGRSVIVVRREAGEERFESAEPVADLARVFESGGVLGIRLERPGLEAVFLNLTGRSLRD